MDKIQIIQSPNDPRNYRYLTLDNGLRLLLVQQSDSDKSAAALTVNVGHFDDPDDRQGLAHFLEHMLFLGSKRYPKAGDYQHFISHHGGSHNAWTGTEHSSFYFDIEHAYYDQALSRFADMFIAPLFNADYVEKERHAIEAEFSLKLKDDGRRIYQVHKESINPAHPFAKFSVGNLSTLADTTESSLQQALVQFFHREYSASRMTLTLVSAHPLDELARLATEHFSAIKADLPVKAPLTVPLYLPQHQGIALHIQPHRDSRKLVVSFALPDIQRWYRHKLISFIAHLLGDEGEGSLLSYLKQQGLVNQLSAGGGIDGSNYKDFTIAFELTEHGLRQRDTILKALFSAIATLKQQPLPQPLFAERQKLLQWAFLYQEPATALQTATHLSVSMQHYPITDVIFGDYRMELPDDTLYRLILSYFDSNNMRLMLIYPEAPTQFQARWYDTPYSIETLPGTLLAELAQQDVNPQITLPQINPYLHGDISLLEKEQHANEPVRYYQDDNLNLWYKADTDFNSPKGHCFVQLSLPHSVSSVSDMAATRLWVELFLDNINQQFYPATTVGLIYQAHVQHQGISLHTSGLTNNQLQLLDDILTQMPEQQFTAERFDELKQQLCRHWRNSSKNKPVARLFSQLSALLQPHNPEIDQLADELAQLSFIDFLQFHQQLWQQVHIEALLIGNWQPAQAQQMQHLLQSWQRQLTSTGSRPPLRSLSIRDLGPVWLPQHVEHNDHALVIYLPADAATVENTALFMLANHLLSPEYFHQLRTEQQLGYLVGTGYVPVNMLPGVAFYVQSPHTDCNTLYEATVMFFRAFLCDTEALTADEFNEMKHGLLAQLQERDNSLGARAKRFWLAIGQKDYRFDLTQRLISALQQLQLNDFIRFLHQLLRPDYDAIFLATSPPGKHGHLTVQTVKALRLRLQQMQIGFDSTDKVL